MKKVHESIDQMLPYGELLRGFATQSSISKGELKKVLRGRGIFFRDNEKEDMVPCLSALLLSPSEFEVLKDCQNNREDNPKKSSSRIILEKTVSFADIALNTEDLQTIVANDYANYQLTKVPDVFIDSNNINKMTINFEIERFDWNKSWYETKNIFTGSLTIEKVSATELSITKSYTSVESEEVANKFQNFFVQHLKTAGVVDPESELKRILFKDFTNQQRIVFFWRLTSKMEGVYFEFVDIEDMEFRPDESLQLPEKIDWMSKKKELILKGTEIHNTFFIKEVVYYPFLQFWGIDAKFKFNLANEKGSCVVNFLFKDFLHLQGEAEFEINISSLTPETPSLTQRQKIDLKKNLLDLFEKRKNEIYQSFFSVASQIPV